MYRWHSRDRTLVAVCRDMYRAVRQQVIDLVLATDMSKHFDHLNRFVEHTAKLHTSSAHRNVSISLLFSYDQSSSCAARIIQLMTDHWSYIQYELQQHYSKWAAGNFNLCASIDRCVLKLFCRRRPIRLYKSSYLAVKAQPRSQISSYWLIPNDCNA